MKGTRIVARTQADALGRYRLHDLPPGAYDVSIRALGFRPLRATATIGADGAATVLALRLVPGVVQLGEVAVTAEVVPS